MSKNIKKTIAIFLLIGSVSVIKFPNNINLLNQPVYASSFDSDDALLKSLKTDEGSVSFSSKKSTINGKVKSNVDEVKITATAEDSSYEITIDDETGTGSCSTTVDLKKNKNNRIKVKVEDPSGKKNSVVYYVNIQRGNSSSSSNSYSNDDLCLENISVSEGTINFSKDKYSYNIYVSDSISSMKIKAKPENDDDFTVSINGAVIDEDDNYKMSVNLSKGENYVPVKVKDDDGNSSTYNLYIYRGDYSQSNITEGKIDNTQDDIYLDELSVDEAGTNIRFRPKVTYYEINVDKDCDSIIVKAEPDESNYTVRINDDKVKEKSKYKKRVYLNEGRNEIKIRVDDKEDGDSYKDYDKRTYTLVVNRGKNNSSVLNNSQTSESMDTTLGNIKEDNKLDKEYNKWIKNQYNQWMYKDTTGNILRDKWFYDINLGKWYKFNSEGIMCTGFQYENEKTYYLNNDGSMQIGWKQIGQYWYLFRGDGSMVTKGWYQDSNGKWYYFYDGGAMASSVRIGNYIIGSDGALI